MAKIEAFVQFLSIVKILFILRFKTFLSIVFNRLYLNVLQDKHHYLRILVLNNLQLVHPNLAFLRYKIDWASDAVESSYLQLLMQRRQQ